MSQNQRQLRNYEVDTLANLKTIDNASETTRIWCAEQKTLYVYIVAGSGYTANDKEVCITGAGGDTRWVGISGIYSYLTDIINEILPIEIFEDGAVPPSELAVYATTHHKYRDFTVNDLVDTPVYKRSDVINPAQAKVIMIISGADTANEETINFEISINGGGAVSIPYESDGVVSTGTVTKTAFVSVAFGTTDYNIELKRVAGTYAGEIGVIAIEVG